MRIILSILLFFLFAKVLPAQDSTKPRLLVLTDIGGDPDDQQSLVRLLVYANEFRIEGIIATSDNIPRKGYQHRIRTDLVHRTIDAYEQVRDNLLLHDPDYPSAESLRKGVKGGQVDRGVGNLKPGRATDGSQHIIQTVDASNEPLYVAIWGGAHDLAQALLDVKRTRTGKEVGRFVEKLRVFAISDQDGLNGIHPKGTGQWIRENFSNIKYVESGPLTGPIMDASFRGMYQNDSRGGGEPLPLVRPGIEKKNDGNWIREHINSMGPLGRLYPPDTQQNPGSERNGTGVKEGDTPSWFLVYPNGLNDPERPEWGGWGGRFRPQAQGYYVDAEDDHWSGRDDQGLRQKWTVARWREAYQNDFEARMQWNVKPYGEANHNPVAIVNGDRGKGILHVAARPGETIAFDAGPSYDPDGDDISFHWWPYKEVSVGSLEIDRGDQAAIEVKIPLECPKGDVHLILEVKDKAKPNLVAYRRIIVEVR